jgi:hypothetical protein
MVRTKGPIVTYILANKHQTYVHTEYADESGQFDKNIHLTTSTLFLSSTYSMYIYRMMIQLYIIIHMHEHRVCNNVGMQQELATGPFDLVSSRKLIYLIQLAIEYYDRLDSDSDTLGT